MQDRHADAQQAYRAALQAAPEMAAALTNLGLSYALAGEAHQAVATSTIAAEFGAPERVRHDPAAALATATDAIPGADLYADAPGIVSGRLAKQAAR